MGKKNLNGEIIKVDTMIVGAYIKSITSNMLFINGLSDEREKSETVKQELISFTLKGLSKS